MFGSDLAMDDYGGIPLKVKLAVVKHDMDLSRIKNTLMLCCMIEGMIIYKKVRMCVELEQNSLCIVYQN